MSEKLSTEGVSVQISALVPFELRRRLEESARKTGTPKAVIVRWALEHYFASDNTEAKPGAKPIKRGLENRFYEDEAKKLKFKDSRRKR